MHAGRLWSAVLRLGPELRRISGDRELCRLHHCYSPGDRAEPSSELDTLALLRKPHRAIPLARVGNNPEYLMR